MSGYLIPAKGGNRGPYSREQVVSLVQQGRIPLSYGVIDAATGQMVMAGSLFKEPGNGGAEAPFTPAPQPARRPRPVSAAAHAHRPALARPPRHPAPGLHRGGSPREAYAPEATAPLKPRANYVPLIIAMAVMAVVLVIALLVYNSMNKGPGLEGTWIPDTDTVESFAAKLSDTARAQNREIPPKKTLLMMGNMLFRNFKLVIDQEAVRFDERIAGGADGAPGGTKVLPRRDTEPGRCEISITGKDGKEKKVTFTLAEENRLFVATDEFAFPLRRGAEN